MDISFGGEPSEGPRPRPEGRLRRSAKPGSLWAMARVEKGIWADLAVTGASFACHVTPRARQPGISRSDDGFRISVTAAPEDGRANEAVRAALANALGVAKTRLVLVSGGSARDKLFRLE